MSQQQENYENQAMQEQLNNDPGYIEWEEKLDKQACDEDKTLDALIEEVEDRKL